MNLEQVERMLFFAAGAGLFLCVACTAGLRASVGEDPDLRKALFDSPLLDLERSRLLLRARYFVPWTPTPDGLKESLKFLPRLLFWGARLGGMLVAIGFLTFLLVGFWHAGHP